MFELKTICSETAKMRFPVYSEKNVLIDLVGCFYIRKESSDRLLDDWWEQNNGFCFNMFDQISDENYS